MCSSCSGTYTYTAQYVWHHDKIPSGSSETVCGGWSNEGSSLLIHPMDLDVYFHARKIESQAGPAHKKLDQASVCFAAPQDTGLQKHQWHRALPFDGTADEDIQWLCSLQGHYGPSNSLSAMQESPCEAAGKTQGNQGGPRADMRSDLAKSFPAPLMDCSEGLQCVLSRRHEVWQAAAEQGGGTQVHRPH